MQYILALVFLGAVCDARHVMKRDAQIPKVWDAVKELRGKNSELTIEQIQELYLSVKPGDDFPILAEIPAANVACDAVIPGFYANDKAGRCQTFDRCDITGVLTSYLCPNMTLFNQITLICDWWYNVDCSKSRSFYDYSNSRLYTDTAVLFDNQDEVLQITGAVKATDVDASVSGSSKSQKKKPKSAA